MEHLTGSKITPSLPAYEFLLDTKGLLCPEPLMLLHQKIREIDENLVILLEATDPSTQRDVVKFCTYLGHELMASDCAGSVYRYFIKKKQFK